MACAGNFRPTRTVRCRKSLALAFSILNLSANCPMTVSRRRRRLFKRFTTAAGRSSFLLERNGACGRISTALNSSFSVSLPINPLPPSTSFAMPFRVSSNGMVHVWSSFKFRRLSKFKRFYGYNLPQTCSLSTFIQLFQKNLHMALNIII